MARNPVAANLAMLILIVGGFLMGTRLKQEIFPKYELDVVQVAVAYPGASPQDVEQGILLAVEDVVRGVNGIKKVTSLALEGKGIVSIELLSSTNQSKALQDVKNRVDRITSFPEEAERPVISLGEDRREVISLIIYGQESEKTLRNFTELIREELLLLPEVTVVEMPNARPLIVSVEIPQGQLRAYQLSLEQVAALIQNTAIELPGGGVQAPGGEILLRTDGRRDWANQYRQIPIVVNNSGTRVRLGDIADVQDAFEETDQESFFNGLRAMRLNVFRVGDQRPLDIAEVIHRYVEEKRTQLPSSIGLALWNDRSEVYRDRISLLFRNGLSGLIIVMILLGLFLETRLAFWVTVGIPTSIVGSFLILSFYSDVSINMVSLFAFIVTLGIIVDDAVVVGEIVCKYRERGYPYLQAAILGTKEIAMPVIFAVLTNMVAFAPLLFIPGVAGKIFFQIPAITISVFAISLLESLFVLPAHLVPTHRDRIITKVLNIPRQKVTPALNKFISRTYLPLLKIALRHRYTTLAIGLAMMLLSLGSIAGGHLAFSFLPKIEDDLVQCQVYLPFGSPLSEARAMQAKITEAAQRILQSYGDQPIAKGIYAQIGSPINAQGGPTGRASGQVGAHIVGVEIELVPPGQRPLTSEEFASRWRHEVGTLVGINSIDFNATIASQGGSPIDIQISHPHTATLEKAAEQLGDVLAQYRGVTDIDNGVARGKPQLNLKIAPEGEALGLTNESLARQVRSSFYGAEALRQQRGRNEVKVLVRLPQEERAHESTVEDLILTTPKNGEIPLREAAQWQTTRSYTTIQRANGQRILHVTADVQEEVGNANTILQEVVKDVIPPLLRKYPGLTFSLEGQQREQSDSLEAMKAGFILTLVALYGLLAIPFRSYIHPFVVMMAIPFGMIGAILGHILLGQGLSIMSLFGIIALSGVVINDSLVLVVTANRVRAKSDKTIPPERALTYAASTRFRPIILTSLTTFGGLAPIIFEPSVQARFLAPMAISLGFGILFSTIIILVLIPCLYLMVEDIRDTLELTWLKLLE